MLAATTGALFGTYYDNADFTASSFTRDDPGIHFDWSTRAPLTRMGQTNFSVRWIGQVKSTTAGTYTFNVDSDGIAALRVRGQNIVLTPTGVGTASTGTINLPANQLVDLQLDYVHTTGTAHVSLDWTPPGSTSAAAIPTANLYNTFATPRGTVSNLTLGAGQDPWVIQWHDEYIYVWSDGGRIYGSRSARLQDITTAPRVTLWTAPSTGAYSRDVWAPELQRLDGKWYLYFAADNGTNANHHMFVASRDSDNPLGTFTFNNQLAATTDRWAIDGTVLETGGLRYFVWSGWPGTTDGQQNLYIAQMSSPTTLVGERAMISTPSYSWEKNGLPINEGPEVIQRNGETHIIFSASGYWTNDYALGDLKLTGTNPMSIASWTKKSTPAFSQANGVVGVGHASFVTSPDGTEDWIVYHAHKSATVWAEDRVVRIQPFTFNGGTPVFGVPIEDYDPIAEPRGTPTLLASGAALTAAVTDGEEPTSIVDQIFGTAPTKTSTATRVAVGVLKVPTKRPS